MLIRSDGLIAKHCQRQREKDGEKKERSAPISPSGATYLGQAEE